MSPFLLPFLFLAIVFVAIVIANERWGLFRIDGLSGGRKIAAYVWLAALLFLLGFLVVGSSLRQPTESELAKLPFYSLFSLHWILLIFLGGWWLLAKRPPLGAFFNFQREGNGEAVMTGFAVGVGGWILTILFAIALGAILNATGIMPKAPKPSPMIGWMAALPAWKKAVVVFSAMTVEELFFRGWLQKRVGVIASTLLFALAHAGFGQPLLLVGVGVISLVIGFTFYRTKNILPGIIAHGVFDAVQLFVIIPFFFKLAGLS